MGLKLLMSVALGIALLVAPSRKAEAVAIGEKAPELRVAKWLQGEALKKTAFGKGKEVFVVEFWATWCGPCEETIPHLSAIQKKYRKDKVTVIGISIDDDEEKVVSFLKERKDMDYLVAVDDNNKTYQAYMKEFSGIPRAFVIDRQGKIFWSGHPLQLEKQLERALAKVRISEKEKRRMNLEGELDAAIENQDFLRVQLAGERILEIEKDHSRAIDALFYLQVEVYKDPQKALDFIESRLRVSPGRMPLQLLKVKALTLLEGDHDEKIRSLSDFLMRSPGATPRQLLELAQILVYNNGKTGIRYDLALDVIILARHALEKAPDKGLMIGALDNEIHVAMKLRLPERELRARRELLALYEHEEYEKELADLEKIMKQRRKFLADEGSREEK